MPSDMRVGLSDHTHFQMHRGSFLFLSGGKTSKEKKITPIKVKLCQRMSVCLNHKELLGMAQIMFDLKDHLLKMGSHLLYVLGKKNKKHYEGETLSQEP